MLILNGGALPTLIRCRDQYPHAAEHLGRLARPRHIHRLLDTLNANFKVAVDNEAYCCFDTARFVRQLGQIELAMYGRVLTIGERVQRFYSPGGFTYVDAVDQRRSGTLPYEPLPPVHQNLLFVTVPDVVADARATARQWAEWAPLMAHLPLALCLQDGVEDIGVPWQFPGISALFMAGSDSFKMSDTLADICREGKKRGLHIHAGRVNSRKRIRHMLSLEFVDSLDGTGFDRYRDTHLGWGLREAAATSWQMRLDRPAD